ncbi:MAG TPA: Xaa-Pro peptidase family protein [Geobacteraceae bacterium]
MTNDRVAAAREQLTRHGLDALLFHGLANIRYLAGFTGSDGALLVGHEGCWFLTDSRYTVQATAEAPHCQVREYRGKVEGVAALVGEQGWRRVGFDAEQTTVALCNQLSEALSGVELVPVGSELDHLRLVKDAAELELLDCCATIASDAFLTILPQIKAGAVERDLALELELAMRRAGAEEKSFDFIVASGVRGALPHGKASDKRLAAGELVTFDFGACYQGYHSDETVTVAIGPVDSRQREVYGIVKESHDRALAAVRPGVTARELDDIARGFIDEHGFGQYFGHGLGHGVGLEVHEKPVVSFRGDQVLGEGMVFTIEPGIYIPDWGGVRIEDTVVVTATGYRLLTKVCKELLTV